jgi:sirohydrochlorin cobaltochelatase
MTPQFSDAALVLVGHGSTLNAESAASLRQHAAELRRRGSFAQVLEAFWKQEPGISKTLAGIAARRVFVVPFFLSEGYFTEEIIPRELGFKGEGEKAFDRTMVRGEQTFHYCAPVGTHPAIMQIVLSRAAEVLQQHPFPRAPRLKETALFIAGHGTDRNENSRRAVERQVELIRAENLYAEVHAVFLEEDPRIGACYGMSAVRHFVVVPFFISDGLHANEDIPMLLGEPERLVRERLQGGQATWRNPTERKSKLVWYARTVGTDPRLADLIVDLVTVSAETAHAKNRKP